MRSLRSLAAILTVLAVAACSSAAPGWTYAPAPSATPVPSVEASGPVVASGEPAGSPAAGTIELTAQNIAFDKSELQVPADTAFQIVFHNQDASVPHDVAIHEGSPTGAEVFKGDVFPGVDTKTYDVPALKAGTYGFLCTVHPNMTGTLIAQ